MRPATYATVVDVLDRYLGSPLRGDHLRRFTENELDSFVIEVANFYRAPQHAERSHRGFRMLPSHIFFEGSYYPPDPPYILTSLLYADETVVQCSLGQACLFDAARMAFNRDLAERGANVVALYAAYPEEVEYGGGPRHPQLQDYLAGLVDQYRTWDDLVRRGWLILTPATYALPLRPSASIFHSPPINDIYYASDLIGAIYGPQTPSGGELSQMLRVARAVAFGIHRASEAGARFVPSSPDQAELYFHALSALSGRLSVVGIDSHAAQAVTTADLPLLRDVSQADICAIREDSGAFEAWRAMLREASRLIREAPTDLEAFATDATAVLEDRFRPALAAIRRDTSRSRTFQRVSVDHALDAGLGAVAVTAGALVTGAPESTSALVGLGVGSALGILRDVIVRQGGGEQSAVIAYLAERKQR